MFVCIQQFKYSLSTGVSLKIKWGRSMSLFILINSSRLGDRFKQSNWNKKICEWCQERAASKGKTTRNPMINFEYNKHIIVAVKSNQIPIHTIYFGFRFDRNHIPHYSNMKSLFGSAQKWRYNNYFMLNWKIISLFRNNLVEAKEAGRFPLGWKPSYILWYMKLCRNSITEIPHLLFFFYIEAH